MSNKDMNRRDFLKSLGLGAVATAAVAAGCSSPNETQTEGVALGEVPTDKMTYREDQHGQKVSLLGYGCMRFPTIEGTSGRENDIVAMATFTEEDDAPSTDDAFLTAVKVELVSRVYVKPFTVSFSGVQIYEVPCTNAIPPTGYFAMTNIYKGPKTHVYPNAGYLHIPDAENYVMTDRAGRDVAYTNWFAGTLTWKVPIGWRRIRRGYENQLATDDLDHALYDDDNSRPLLIGGREDAYTQTFKIESDGTSSIRKFGCKLERNRWLPFGFVSQTGED